jgi:hypothetical protein
MKFHVPCRSKLKIHYLTFNMSFRPEMTSSNMLSFLLMKEAFKKILPFEEDLVFKYIIRIDQVLSAIAEELNKETDSDVGTHLLAECSIKPQAEWVKILDDAHELLPK